MKKLNIFGKEISILLIVVVALAISASAALLSQFGEMTGTATVEQSVTLDGTGCIGNVCTYEIGDSPAIAGNSYVDGPMTIVNNADQPISIRFATTYAAVNDSDLTDSEVTTRYYAILNLTSKDLSWNPTDAMKATLTYDLVSPEFNYELVAEGLQANTSYVLIYYADKLNRFVEWGGDNPGALIATVTTNGSGNLEVSDSINLKMNLPQAVDWNAGPDAIDEYCGGSDDFGLCQGAKIWLIPSSDYDNATKKLTAWNPSTYLFETDLITYDDSDTDGEGLAVGHGHFDMYIENTFHPLAMPDTYTIITTIVPK